MGLVSIQEVSLKERSLLWSALHKSQVHSWTADGQTVYLPYTWSLYCQATLHVIHPIWTSQVKWSRSNEHQNKDSNTCLVLELLGWNQSNLPYQISHNESAPHKKKKIVISLVWFHREEILFALPHITYAYFWPSAWTHVYEKSNMNVWNVEQVPAEKGSLWYPLDAELVLGSKSHGHSGTTLVWNTHSTLHWAIENVLGVFVCI